MRRAALLVAALVALLGCDDETASPTDAAPTDARSVDALLPDGASPDARAIDAGAADGARPDIAVADATAPDAARPTLRLIGPTPGQITRFAAPAIQWAAVDGADDYAVAIETAAGDMVAAVETDDLLWRPPPHQADHFRVTVTARPGGETASVDYTVRGLRAEPDVVAPEEFCGGFEGLGTGSSYAAAILGEQVFGTLNVDTAGICVYDLDTLAYTGMVPGLGERYRTFGAAADPVGDRVFVTTYPLLGQCPDFTRRVLVVHPEGDMFRVELFDGRVDSAPTVAWHDGQLYLGGDPLTSCYDFDYFCREELDDPCPFGGADLVGWTFTGVRDAEELFHLDGAEGQVGMTADAARVYRSAGGALRVYDAIGGQSLFVKPTTDTVRSVTRVDDHLIVGEWDDHLRIYRIAVDPPMGPDDLVLEFEIPVPDRYWQGSLDADGRFVWPGQNTRRLYRHDLHP